MDEDQIRKDVKAMPARPDPVAPATPDPVTAATPDPVTAATPDPVTPATPERVTAGPTLDLTKDDAGEPPAPPSPPATAPYDPTQDQETARATIAYLLLLLLSVIIVFAFVLLWAKPWHSDKLTALMQLVFGPIIALVGAATGYYFGAASAQQVKK